MRTLYLTSTCKGSRGEGGRLSSTCYCAVDCAYRGLVAVQMTRARKQRCTRRSGGGLNVAARTSPVRMVGAHSGIAHTREGVRVDTMPGRVESWHLAISPRRQYYVLVERCRRDQTHCSSRLCMCQVRAMNEHNVSCLRTQLRAVRARTREAQAACTSRYLASAPRRGSSSTTQGEGRLVCRARVCPASR